ncbi:hypothetical protein [Terriglobus sp.]|uniref:hypothetical protein n=1 Tax=Terriglobus sp. TaxID=1889013 RepID=UPI003AFFD85B
MDSAPHWHMLQISDVLDEELACALSRDVEVTGWVPEFSFSRALFGRNGLARRSSSPGTRFTTQALPLLRGYARAPEWLGSYLAKRLAQLINETSAAPSRDVLVCTVPYFAGVAERWPGPVVYWLTDMIAQYESARGVNVPLLDRRMCAASTLVCPNSQRLAEYLEQQGCDERKIVVLPNATRQRNTLPGPLREPLLLKEFAGDNRPIAGVIGNLAGNMDWLLLEALVRQTCWLQWVFVGPTEMHIPDAAQSRARMAVQHTENTRFVGKKSYGALAEYARGFHVAVLPYRKCEPTYSGSSTRFYEHLAACRPMLATRGFEELLHKEPLLTLVDTPEQAIAALDRLRECGFNDGAAEERWKASQDGTWENRARTMQNALADRLLVTRSVPDSLVQERSMHESFI